MLLDISPGFFRVRRIRGGPWIAACLTIAHDLIQVSEEETPTVVDFPLAELEVLLVEETVEGRAFAHPLLRLLYFGVRIDADEYAHMLRVAAWARQHAPNHPAANPNARIDLGKLPIKFIF